MLKKTQANMRFQPTASLACARFAAAEARAVMPLIVSPNLFGQKGTAMTTTIAQNTIQESLDPVSAVLLVEHERLASLYEHNARVGEQFVSVYLGVVSVAVALLVSLQELMPQSDTLMIELSILLIISAVGGITFQRLIERRIRSIEYLRAINRVHRYFIDKDPKIQPYFYWPACDDCPPMWIKGTAVGGLRDTVASLNSLFIGFSAAIVIRTLWPTLLPLGLVAIAIIVGLTVWLVQYKYSKLALGRANEGLKKYVSFPQPGDNVTTEIGRKE